jgi:hypothetical protein
MCKSRVKVHGHLGLRRHMRPECAPANPGKSPKGRDEFAQCEVPVPSAGWIQNADHAVDPICTDRSLAPIRRSRTGLYGGR